MLGNASYLIQKSKPDFDWNPIGAGEPICGAFVVAEEGFMSSVMISRFFLSLRFARLKFGPPVFEPVRKVPEYPVENRPKTSPSD